MGDAQRQGELARARALLVGGQKRFAGAESGWMERAWVPGENHRATLHLTRPTHARTRMYERHTHTHTHIGARVSHIGSLLSAGCRIRILRIRFAPSLTPSHQETR